MKKTKTKQNTIINGEIKDTINNIEKLNNIETQGTQEEQQENGNMQTNSDTIMLKRNEFKKKKKNKSKQRDKQLLKKKTQMLRQKTISEGFESFNFSSFVLQNESNYDVSLQNGNSQIEQTSLNSSKKRTFKNISNDNKIKRRKSVQTA